VRISVPRRTALAALLAVMADCQSSPALQFDAGAADGAGSDAAPDVGACGDAYASSSMPFAPCDVDSDCHSAYLYCGPPQGTLTFCRDADAAVEDGCTAPVPAADVPVCPSMIQVTRNVCGVRYRRPCKVDSDCGPGFTCDSSGSSTCPAGSPPGTPCGRCQAPPFAACVTKTDCPNEWDCNAGCGCTPDAQTHCFPPFEIFRCPFCPPIPGP
jgi:hypothetical protein